MKIVVTSRDVCRAEKFKIRNPILYVLQCMTGTLWKMSDDGDVLEQMAPYRQGHFNDDTLELWQRYLLTRNMEPFEFDLELQETLSEPTPAPSKSRRLFSHLIEAHQVLLPQEAWALPTKAKPR